MCLLTNATRAGSARFRKVLSEVRSASPRLVHPIGASLDAAAAWDRLIGLVLNGSEAGRLASPAAPAEQGKGGNPGGAPRGPLQAGLSASAPSSSAAYVQVCQQGLLTWRLLWCTTKFSTLMSVAVASHSCILEWVYRRLRLRHLAAPGLSVSHQGQKPCWRRQVAGKQMVGVYLSVWVHRRLLPAVRGVQVTAVGTGVLGYLGNKGAPPARTPP